MANLFFFWGQEEFLLNSEIQEIKKKNIDKNFEAMAYKKLTEPKSEDVISAIRSLPMMFGNVMHIIDMNKFMLSNKSSESENDEEQESNEDIDLDQLEKALASKSDKNIVVLRVIIPTDSKKKVDTRKKIYKIITKYAQEKQFPILRTFDKTLPDIIINLAKNHNLSLIRPVTQKIIEQVGSNLGIINSELAKLAITIYPEKTVKPEHVENICTQKEDVFIILEALFNKNVDKALYEMKKVFEKTHYLQVMGAIQQSLRNLMLIKINYRKIGKSATAQKMGLHEFITEKNYNLVSKMNDEALYKLKKDLLKAEYAIKSGDCVNPENEIEMALMGVCDV